MAERNDLPASFLKIGSIDRRHDISSIAVDTERKNSDMVFFEDASDIYGLKIGNLGDPTSLSTDSINNNGELDKEALVFDAYLQGPAEAGNYAIGDLLSGNVGRVFHNCALVSIGAGRKGILPFSEMSWSGSIPASYRDKLLRSNVIVEVIDSSGTDPILRLAPMIGAPNLPSFPYSEADIVSCEVTAITVGGIEVRFGEPSIMGFIPVRDITNELKGRVEIGFSVGDQLNAIVSSVDNEHRIVELSVSAVEDLYERRREDRRSALVDGISQYEKYAEGSPLDLIVNALKSSDLI